MRTTVTLDPDVERLLREAARRRRQSFKEVLNSAVREGLRAEGATRAGRPFSVAARPMGIRAGIDPARLSEIGDDLEIDAFLDTARRLRERTSS